MRNWKALYLLRTFLPFYDFDDIINDDLMIEILSKTTMIELFDKRLGLV